MTTLAVLQQQLDAALAARLKILGSQEYVVGAGGQQRRNRRAELAQVSELINDLQAQIARAEAVQRGARRIFYVRGL